MRLLIAFCIGIAGTLAWQSFGDAARGMIASSYPQLGWLASQSVLAKTAPASITQPITSPDTEELKTISLSLVALRQRFDELAASRDQITRDVDSKLQGAKQEILDRISEPSKLTTASTHKPALPTPQVSPTR
jgi:hypothetical protein